MIKPSKLLVALALLALNGCQDAPKNTLETSTEPASPDYTRVEFETILSDEISIRAIDADNSKILYAGTGGKYGHIDKLTQRVERGTLYLDTIPLHFRMAQRNRGESFVMSIETPAMLYRINDDGIQPVYTEAGDGVFYDALQFYDDGQHALAFGDPVDGCFSVLRSFDAGATWIKVDCASLPDFLSNEAGFAASNSSIATSGNRGIIVTGGGASRALITDDYGLTWRDVILPIKQGGGMTGAYALDFVGETAVVVGGDWDNKGDNNMSMAISKDSGNTWSSIRGDDTPGYRSDVSILSDNGQEILAVGSPGMDYSKDGGKSWKHLTNEPFYAFVMVSDSTGYAAGRDRVDFFTLTE